MEPDDAEGALAAVGAGVADDAIAAMTGLGSLATDLGEVLEQLVAAHVRDIGGGDPERSLAAIGSRDWLAAVRAGHAGTTLIEEAPPAAAAAGMPVAVPGASERYQLGPEIGRGGLGRVVAATDLVLGREVAVKELLGLGMDARLARRFRREGEIAGRLSHPNVIPVHDVGVRDAEGVARPYFVMSRVVGTDLSQVLADLERGQGAAVVEYSRPRLLRWFHDVCQGVAYAHDRGVIHRDLKPANIMIGESGEVYVVDWGLAKIRGEAEADDLGAAAPPGGEDREPDTTVEGALLGTPQYMSPEQARGETDAVDELSDIYSLGGILYEILTLRPPADGETVYQVLMQVARGTCELPSRRADAVRAGLVAERPGDDIVLPLPVSPELEAIVLRAMARDRDDRYRSAWALAEDVRNYLDGAKTRERLASEVSHRVAEARAQLAERAKLQGEARAIAAAVRDAQAQLEPHWPVERKRPLWGLQDRERELADAIARRTARAEGLLREALGMDPDDRAARAALADLSWERYEALEAAGDAAGSQELERRIRGLDAERFHDRFGGRGRLAVSVRRFACACLTDGREVAPEDWRTQPVAGGPVWHPASGRRCDGDLPAPGAPGAEPDAPVRVRVHGAGCRPEPALGIEVWLFAFAERDRTLVPVAPTGVESAGARLLPVPETLLDAAFPAGSPYRPAAGLRLGLTPFGAVDLPMGRYLAVAAADGCVPLRVTFRVGRAEELALDLTIYGSGEVPPGFVPVNGGPFHYQGDAANPYSGPAELRRPAGLFLARDPVCCGDYLEFLNALWRTDPAAARARVPRKAPSSGRLWPERADGFVLPDAAWADAASPAERAALALDELQGAWWDPAWPVMAISWEDAMAYAGWRRAAGAWCFTLADEVQWEWAARGGDGRPYPWGEVADGAFYNGSRSQHPLALPAPPGRFVYDESGAGIRGLGGNMSEWCLNEPPGGEAGWRVWRGGNWNYSPVFARSTTRAWEPPGGVQPHVGVRLAAVPQLCGPPS